MDNIKVGDMVECVDKGDCNLITKGKEYKVLDIIEDRIRIINNTSYKLLYDKRLFKPVFTPEYFTALNYKDAEKYIGKTMEFADTIEQIKNNLWLKGELLEFDKNHTCLFKVKYNSFIYMRTCPETFKEIVDPKLIEALKKSIQQWQIMYDTGKDKEEVYEFLGGKECYFYCFLCDYTGYSSWGGNINNCKKCIKWFEDSGICFDGGLYTTWENNKSKENTLNMLNHLKSELKRLELL